MNKLLWQTESTQVYSYKHHYLEGTGKIAITDSLQKAYDVSNYGLFESEYIIKNDIPFRGTGLKSNQKIFGFL